MSETYLLCYLTAPIDVCTLKKDTGDGNGSEKRWYFNESKCKCKSFTYKGTGGNENNFESKNDCEEFCSAFRPPGKRESQVLKLLASLNEEIYNTKNEHVFERSQHLLLFQMNATKTRTLVHVMTSPSIIITILVLTSARSLIMEDAAELQTGSRQKLTARISAR